MGGSMRVSFRRPPTPLLIGAVLVAAGVPLVAPAAAHEARPAAASALSALSASAAPEGAREERLATTAEATGVERAEPVLPDRVRDETVVPGLSEPTAAAFSPDGAVLFVTIKQGTVKAYDRQPDGSYDDAHPTTFVDLTTEVHNYYDRGLLAVTVDPGWPERPYVYVSYAYDKNPTGDPTGDPDAVPAYGGSGSYDDCGEPYGPAGVSDGQGGLRPGCVVTGRVSRLTAVADADGFGWVSDGTETPLVDGGWCFQFPSHATGDLAFGPDGMLYASGGEGASFDFDDYGQVGNPCQDPVDEGGSLRSQDVRTSGDPDADPTGLNGAVLRLDPDTGLAAAGNPLAGPDENARRILAYGLRNPFRFAFRPGTSQLWVGDVGGGRYEEIDRIDTAAATARDFGWPCYEGPQVQPAWNGLDKPLCEDLYRSGDAVAPAFSYVSRGGAVSPEDSCPTGTGSVSGVAFADAGAYPTAFAGSLVFSDYSRQCLWYLGRTASGAPDPSSVHLLEQGAASPVDLLTGPDGDLYYVSLGVDDRGYPVPGAGSVRRLHHYAGNQPPVADLVADQTYGDAPLTVTLDASGSRDPDGDPVSFAWDTDGDGVFDDGTGATVQVTYTDPDRNVTPAVQVTDEPATGEPASARAALTVYPGDHPPVLTVTSPDPDSPPTWQVGQRLDLLATATDPEEGDLAGRPDAFSWSVVIRHCPSVCHSHPYTSFAYTNEASFQAPDHEYPSTLLVTATVTDGRNLTTRQSIELQPRSSRLRFTSSPTGLRVKAGDTAGRGFVERFIVGSRFTVSAPQKQRLGGRVYVFRRWEEGSRIVRARVHDVTAPASGRTYTAVYRRR